MVPLLIVGLKKPYLKKMGFQEMVCVQPTNLKHTSPVQSLAPNHELPAYTRIPIGYRRVGKRPCSASFLEEFFSETQWA